MFMKKTYTTLLVLFALLFSISNMQAQFVVAQDTIRGRIDFCPRPSDFNNAIQVSNDSVFFLFPVDLEIDPWRHVAFYDADRNIKRGYIRGTDFMRVDDYEIVEVGKISAFGNVFFQNDDVRIDISVKQVSSKDNTIKQDHQGNSFVGDKEAKGISRWSSPQLRYQSISTTIKGKKIVFPEKVYAHLFNPALENMVVYYNPDKLSVYIIADNGSDDAFYQAMWVVTPDGVSNVYVFDPKQEEKF